MLYYEYNLSLSWSSSLLLRIVAGPQLHNRYGVCSHTQTNSSFVFEFVIIKKKSNSSLRFESKKEIGALRFQLGIYEFNYSRVRKNQLNHIIYHNKPTQSLISNSFKNRFSNLRVAYKYLVYNTTHSQRHAHCKI